MGGKALLPLLTMRCPAPLSLRPPLSVTEGEEAVADGALPSEKTEKRGAAAAAAAAAGAVVFSHLCGSNECERPRPSSLDCCNDGQSPVTLASAATFSAPLRFSVLGVISG